MNRKKGSFLSIGWVGSLALFFLLTLLIGTAKDSVAEDLKIGVIQPLSGSLALQGKESLEGSEVARVERNEKGGLLGKKIEYVVVDAPDAKAAVGAAERLITLDKMQIIIGTFSSTLSFAASNVAEKYGVIYWELGAISDPIVERGFKYLFRTCPAGSMYSYSTLRCMAEYLAPKMGKKADQTSVAMVYEDSLFGTTMAKYGVEAAKKYGMKVAAQEQYNAKTMDLTPVILRLKAANPDFLWYTGYLTDQILFFRQAKELRFNFKAIITLGGTTISAFAETLGDDTEGIGLVGLPLPQMVNPAFAKGGKEFLALYEKVMKKPLESTYPVMNYVGTKALFAVIEKANSMEPEAIRKAALSMDVPLGETATTWGIKFDPNTGQNLRAFLPVEQYQEKKMKTVWPEEAGIAKMIFPFPKWEERIKK